MPYQSFGFTDHQLMIRDAIVGLMERELPPERIEALEKASAYPEDAFQVLAREGWLGLPYPEELGGAAASYKDMAVFIEALAYV
ncbi:MAG: acyl-CoA dehydrogenase family protein, partial [Rickettsiales bacterium]